MKRLRKMIRRLILEGDVKDTFEQEWFTSNSRPHRHSWEHFDTGTFHKDALKDELIDSVHSDVDDFFEGKRDLKRAWNKTIDEYGLRSFWEGPKMQYYHSLSYYGDPTTDQDKIVQDVDVDEEIRDLSSYGFFQMYNKTGNKDEMSTFGIYNGQHQIGAQQLNFGVLLKGRVTLATMEDAFTESRSKAKPSDMKRHKGSGLPKRVLTSDSMIDALLFEEGDIKEFGRLGECILDNWSIEAIVCNNSEIMREELHDVILGAQKLANSYGVPLLEPRDLGVTFK